VHLKGVEEMTIFSEELKSLIKNHLRHSLCSTPVSIQSRIYLDDEEISNLRQEKPAPKELSDEEILVLYEEFIETQYVSESNVLGFGRAILKKASEK
jgi:hypothetical protein